MPSVDAKRRWSWEPFAAALCVAGTFILFCGAVRAAADGAIFGVMNMERIIGAAPLYVVAVGLIVSTLLNSRAANWAKHFAIGLLVVMMLLPSTWMFCEGLRDLLGL